MSNNVVSSLLTKLFIATGANANSACDTEAEYEALTWTEVGDITNYSPFGRAHQVITHEPVGDAATYKLKGGFNEGALNLTMGRAPSDAGQTAIIAARNNTAGRTFYNFKVQLNDDTGLTGSKPTRMFFPGLVMSYTTNIGGRNNTVVAECSIEISGTITDGPRVAGS